MLFKYPNHSAIGLEVQSEFGGRREPVRLMAAAINSKAKSKSDMGLPKIKFDRMSTAGSKRFHNIRTKPRLER